MIEKYLSIWKNSKEINPAIKCMRVYAHFTSVEGNDIIRQINSYRIKWFRFKLGYA